MHLIIRQPDGIDPSWSAAERVIASQRFIGNMELPNDRRITTPLGEALFPRLQGSQKPTPDFEARELPEETFGYQFFLGD